MVPAWRPSLDSGLLDVRWLRADLRFSRLRAVVGLLAGALGHSRVYGERQVPEFDVELAVPGMLATDGEVVEEAGRYTFRVADAPHPGLPPRRAAVDRAGRPYQRVKVATARPSGFAPAWSSARRCVSHAGDFAQRPSRSTPRRTRAAAR